VSVKYSVEAKSVM